jgi:hypothetical protein
MKRAITAFAVCVLLGITQTAAFAAELDTAKKAPSNVTITVVMPEPVPEPAPEPEPVWSPGIKAYPSDVAETREGGIWQIVKTYELAAHENPADIPRADFERGAWKFSLTDIVRKETATAETRAHTETVTMNTDTKELEKILPLLTPAIDYTAEDGFVGVLALDVASIKVETAGTKTTSYEMKVTREYPRLSAADTSLVPKTVTEKGKTYTLAGVDWRAGNYETIDYEQVPEYYTAAATYTATGRGTKVTGYVVTAVYSGALAKLAQGKTVYTAYFIGEEIRTPLEMADLAAAGKPAEPPATASNVDSAASPSESTAVNIADTKTPNHMEKAEPTAQPADEPAVTAVGETSKSNNALYVLLPILGAAVGILLCIFISKRRNPHNEKTADTAADAGDSDGDSDDSGSSG